MQQNLDIGGVAPRQSCTHEHCARRWGRRGTRSFVPRGDWPLSTTRSSRDLEASVSAPPDRHVGGVIEVLFFETVADLLDSRVVVFDVTLPALPDLLHRVRIQEFARDPALLRPDRARCFVSRGTRGNSGISCEHPHTKNGRLLFDELCVDVRESLVGEKRLVRRVMSATREGKLIRRCVCSSMRQRVPSAVSSTTSTTSSFPTKPTFSE